MNSCIRCSVVLVALLAAIVWAASIAGAQEVELTFDPPEGAVLDAPPEKVHICFSEPVPTADDLNSFSLETPGERLAGLRIVFQPSGECVDVVVGEVEGATDGEWKLRWHVTSAQGAPMSGTHTFTVGQGAEPGATTTPVAGETPSATATPDGGRPSAGDDDGGDQEILGMALITLAIALGAAALGLVLYLLRLRIGFWLHRPDGDSDQGHD